MSEDVRIVVADGKYTFVKRPGESPEVLRYKAPFHVVREGANAVTALLYAHNDLTEKLDRIDEQRLAHLKTITELRDKADRVDNLLRIIGSQEESIVALHKLMNQDAASLKEMAAVVAALSAHLQLTPTETDDVGPLAQVMLADHAFAEVLLSANPEDVIPNDQTCGCLYDEYTHSEGCAVVAANLACHEARKALEP